MKFEFRDADGCLVSELKSYELFKIPVMGFDIDIVLRHDSCFTVGNLEGCFLVDVFSAHEFLGSICIRPYVVSETRRLHDESRLQVQVDDIIRELFGIGYNGGEVRQILEEELDRAYWKFVEREDEDE